MSFNYPKQFQRNTRHFITIKKKVWIIKKDSGVEVAQFFIKKRKINRNKWGAQNCTHNYWCGFV